MGDKFVISVEQGKGDRGRVVISDVSQRKCEVIALAELAKRARRAALAGEGLGIEGVDAKGNVVSDNLVPWRSDIAPESHRFGTLDEIIPNPKNDNKPVSSKVGMASLASVSLGAESFIPATITDKSFGSRLSGSLGEFSPIGDLVGLFHHLDISDGSGVSNSDGYARYNAPDISWAYIHLFVDTNSFFGSSDVTLKGLVNEVSRKCLSLGICTIMDNCTRTGISDDIYSIYLLCPVHTDWLIENFSNPYLKLVSHFIKGHRITRDGIYEDDHFVIVTYRLRSSFFFKFKGYYLRLDNMLPVSDIEQYSLAQQARVWGLRRAKLAGAFDKYMRRIREGFRCGKNDSPAAKGAVKFNPHVVPAARAEDLELFGSRTYQPERWIPIEEYISSELSFNGRLVAYTDELSGSVFPKPFNETERDIIAKRTERNWRLVWGKGSVS